MNVQYKDIIIRPQEPIGIFLTMLSRSSSSHSRRSSNSRSDATRELFGALEQSPPSLDLIRPLLEAFPRAARSKDAFDNLPLHTACSHGASLPILQLLVQAYPAALKMVGSEEDYPLHLACIVGASTETISYLGNKWPAAFLAPNKRQSRPLHLVVARQPTVETVSLMLSKGSGALKCKDNNRDLPLHVACKHGASLDILQLLVRKYSAALQHANSRGDWPLHVAMRAAAPIHVVTWLMERAPKALIQPNILHDTPLHLAVANKDACTTALVSLLLQQAPEALLMPNVAGDLPLHKALGAKANYQVVHLLVSAHGAKAALMTPNKHGFLPLHVACQHQVDVALVILLVEACPAAVSVRTKNGILPLHLACNHHAAMLDVITLLVSNWTGNGNATTTTSSSGAAATESNSAAAAAAAAALLLLHNNTTDEEDYQGVNICTTAGDTPLHLAIYQQTPRAIIRYLLSIWPQGLLVLNKHGKSPLERARRPYRGSPSRSTVNWLTKKFLAQFLQALQKDDPTATTAAHITLLRQLIKTHPDVCCQRPDEAGYLALHRAVMAPHPSSAVIKELATAWPQAITKTTPNDGNTPLHLAAKALQDLDYTFADSRQKAEELTLAMKTLATTDAVRIRNTSHGALALHIIASTQCLEALQCLVKVWPAALFQVDHAECTPLDYAQQAGVEDVLRWLTKRKRHEDRLQAMNNSSDDTTAAAAAALVGHNMASATGGVTNSGSGGTGGSGTGTNVAITHAAAAVSAAARHAFGPRSAVAFLNPAAAAASGSGMGLGNSPRSSPRIFRGTGGTLSGPARRLGLGGAEEQ